ncbi:MAG: hypothetical protein NWF00_01830 [Candidatus Bathyarchaeota archaeon]|nr:hypothetical protein [Candidatus Bathyarchaeota archaeon]
MNPKRYCKNLIRGWLPEETKLSVYRKTADERFSPMVRLMAKALVAGAVASGLLNVVGGMAGLTNGIGAIVWPAATCVTFWTALGVVSVFARHKEEHQRRKETWVH